MPDAPVTAAPPPRLRPPETLARPGMSPLVRVLAPLVVLAMLLSFVLSRYSAHLAPSRPAPAVRFTDVTGESGIDFVHQGGVVPELEAPTTLGGGAAVIDFNRDGFADLFFVNAMPWPWMDGPAEEAHCALYQNDGRGRFTDVTARAGLALELQGMGAAVGDYDADGWPDLLVTGVGVTRLYRNQGDGTFADVTESAGLDGLGQSWTTGALWLDLDGDARLDLIVCQYARWPREVDLELAFKIAGVGRSYGAPAGFVSAAPLVYRNIGDGRFVEGADEIGLRNLSPDNHLPRPETLGVAPLDLNGDGLLDLVFYYHALEPTYYLNQGGGRFREWVVPGARREGAAADLLVSNPLSSRSTPGLEVMRILRSAGGPAAGAMKVAERFGIGWVDYDLDGWPDILSGGGRAEPELNRFDSGRAFEQPPFVLWNRGESWAEVPLPPETGWARPLRVRGVITADLDADGDEDAVLVQNGAAARVLRNDQRTGAAWLQIALRGTRSVRAGYGARVEIHTPRHKITRIASPAAGYLSQSDDVLTFGLGEDARVRRIVVTWPSGVRQEISSPQVNRRIEIQEPSQ